MRLTTGIENWIKRISLLKTRFINQTNSVAWEGLDLEKPWTQQFSNQVSKLDVFYFFRHILGRMPEEREWTGHCGFIGGNLTDAVTTYYNSSEFKNRKLVGFSPAGIRKVEIDGYVIYAAENDVAVGSHIIANQNYEPAVSDIFRSFLKPGMNVIDIGANIGWFSLLSASIVGRGGRVFSFEPSINNARFLLLNKSANAFEQIFLVHAAASDRIECLAYSSSGSNGSVKEFGDADEEAILNTEIVFAVPADLIVPEDLPIDLIKVDVEGWEMKALRGADRIVQRWKPRIISEFSPPSLFNSSEVSGEEFLEVFKKSGYLFRVIRDGLPLLDCGSDAQRVIDAFETSKTDHIDILMIHAGS